MDRYDEQIQRLCEAINFQSAVKNDLGLGKGLFDFACRGSKRPTRPGCLTMIRCGGFKAQTPELTEEIRKDERIPKDYRDVTPEHLPVFAEWQRRLDKELEERP